MAGGGGGGGITPPPEITYLRKNGKGAQTYILSSDLSINELPFAGEGHLPIVIDCTALNGNKKSCKSISIVVDDSDSNNMLLDLWFGNTSADVVKASETESSCRLAVIEGKLDITLPVTTGFFAIDYNNAGSQPNAMTTFIMITIN
jgi:hypothetical protein